MWPAESLIERIWRLHRREPAWRRWLGGTLLFLLTIVTIVAYLALLIGLVVAGYLVVTRFT